MIFITIASEHRWYRYYKANMYIGLINGSVAKTFIDKPAAQMAPVGPGPFSFMIAEWLYKKLLSLRLSGLWALQ